MNYAIRYCSRWIRKDIPALISSQIWDYHHGWICYQAIIQALEGSSVAFATWRFMLT